MTVDVLRNVQDRIRDITKEKRCRFSENFLDYDKLRSGYVTNSQFSRVLKQLLNSWLRDEEREALYQKYGDSKDGRVNWMKFVKDIEGEFDTADLSVPPETKLLKTIESPLIGVKAARPKLGDDQIDQFRSILSRICQFVSWYGYDLRDCFRQFDVHHIGEVSESQFYRSLPGPKDLTEQELTLLVNRYKSLKNAGSVDYLSFVNEVEKLKSAEKIAKDGEKIDALGSERLTEYAVKDDLLVPSLNMILDRIRLAVRRRGVRVLDFFVDYDKLNHDAVTQSQFACALMLAIGKEAQLSKEDVQMLCNAYAKPGCPDHVTYRNFCRSVDEVHYSPDLEKDPVNYPDLLPTGALSRGLPTLSPEEEQKVSKLLDEIASKVHKNRILVYPYFRDYDLGTGNTRVISANQFARVLQFLGLGVSEEDCRRLCRKFSDPTTGMVNYPLFCQVIDPTFTAQSHKLEQSDVNLRSQQNGSNDAYTFRGHKIDRNWEELVTPNIKTAGDDWPPEVVLDRIRHLVLTHRIQLKPWFQDYDKLRSGYVTLSQFARALTSAGITRLDLHELSPSQLEGIAKAYSSPHDKNLIDWVRFVNDVDSVFTLPNLERDPLKKVPPQETYVQPKPGSADWETATDEMRAEYDEAMAMLRRKIMERRMLLIPDFLAFDKFHRGIISTKNFRQLITMFDFSISPAGIDAILARHSNDDGFDYLGFLKILDPPDPSERKYMYPERLRILQETNLHGKERKEMEPVIRDTEGVMDQIKMDVYRQRLRLADAFRDFDTLNHGTLPSTTFRRCLGSLPLTIGETALSLIEDRFRTTKNGEINWRAFCEEIERAFQTPHLEKDPLIEPDEYKPIPVVEQNTLSVDVAKKADHAIVKIADRVRQRRLQISPMFNDFDETHRRTVSQTQFRRVLATLNLAELVTEDEWSCLYWKYRHPMGVVDNINYQAFVEDVYRAAGIDPFVP